jgi:hypothetical protein
MYEKVSLDMRLVGGFNEEFTTVSRNESKIACLDRLHWMYISLGTLESNPIDIDIYMITHNWMDFIKIHLQHP